ncbi:MAG TPA: type III PLP-dependent enzyme [candidate division Zixibacteria bacterium]|nr:type III PLP-dependent enzyme [candidate division Zixibacteria bacterium]
MKAINVYEGAALAARSQRQFEAALRERDVRGLDGPVLFLSRERVRENLRSLQSALPGVHIYYATKSNNHASILRTVVEEGHGFDVCSAREIEDCLKAGATTADLLHTHPIKSQYEIEQALALGVTTFVVDNVDEVAKFEEYSDRVSLIVRFRAVDSSESAAVVQCNLSYKFGCAPQEIIGLVREITGRNIGFAGLAFHVGSQCQTPAPYLAGINIASDVITQLEAEGIRTRLLDIGGGFPVEYTEAVPSIEEFCGPISEALQSVIPSSVNILCEPGRYISATAVTALVNVIGRSAREGRQWYYIDDGVYGAFSGRIYDHCDYRTLTNRNSAWIPSALAGPTCDSIDIVYEDIFLPPLEVGDTLVFPCMGAYCAVSASTFNSLRQAQTVVID